MQPLDKFFWNNCYINNTTQWDLGTVSPPIKSYIDQLANKDLSILIPGCGNAYEAEYLLSKGFTNITLIDIAKDLVIKLQLKFQDYTNIKIIEDDFFNHQGKYNLILEQTFLCALNKNLRPQYAKKMSDLLVENGKLVGVLFNKEFETEGPPFGGSIEEYRNNFQYYFHFKVFETCFNSFSKRENSELFIIFQKK